MLPNICSLLPIAIKLRLFQSVAPPPPAARYRSQAKIIPRSKNTPHLDNTLNSLPTARPNIHSGAHTTLAIAKLFAPSRSGHPFHPPHYRKRNRLEFWSSPFCILNFPGPGSPPTYFDPSRVLIICHFLLRSIDAANDKKNEPRRGIGARWRGSGHGYYFLLRKFC